MFSIRGKSFLFILLIFIGLLASAGFILSRKYSQEPSRFNAPPLPVTPPTSSTLPVKPSSSIDTKTYTNTEFGFEFQYPQNGKFEENSFYSPFSKFNLQGNSSGANYNPFYPDFLINIVTPDFVGRQFSDLKNIASEINIGGVKGSKYEYKEGGVPHTTIILPFGQYKIIMGFGANKAYQSVFNQILTSFKFLK